MVGGVVILLLICPKFFKKQRENNKIYKEVKEYVCSRI
jgi:hypothetical protein